MMVNILQCGTKSSKQRWRLAILRTGLHRRAFPCWIVSLQTRRYGFCRSSQQKERTHLLIWSRLASHSQPRNMRNYIVLVFELAKKNISDWRQACRHGHQPDRHKLPAEMLSDKTMDLKGGTSRTNPTKIQLPSSQGLIFIHWLFNHCSSTFPPFPSALSFIFLIFHPFLPHLLTLCTDN